MLPQKLLDILACPKCHNSVDYDKKQNKLICKKCRLKYKVLKGDIPDMLVEDAEKF